MYIHDQRLSKIKEPVPEVLKDHRTSSDPCMVCGVVHNMICSITTHTSIHGDQTCDYLGVTIRWLLYYTVVLYNDLIDWICNNLDLSKQGFL